MQLKEEDQLKEQIRLNTEIIKLVFAGFVGTSAGVISLVMSRGSTAVENLFTAGGMVIAVICMVAIIKQYKETQKMINNGNE